MKNWKSRPELFANGKFKIKHESYGLCFIEGFVEWRNDEGERFIVYTKSGSVRYLPPNEVTLIARAIEDMTDEEFEGLSFVVECKERQFFINLLESRIKHDNLRFDDARHLLSIGVYPFSDETDVEYQPKREEA